LVKHDNDSQSETYHFHRLDLTRQAGFIVTVYDEDGLRLAATPPAPTPAQAFAEARKYQRHKRSRQPDWFAVLTALSIGFTLI
jgi:hypothetical protein